jgi:pantoate--beta-alanine ligase
MKILVNKDDLNEALNNVKNLGFVPTMGSLHKGHISLIKKSKKICSKTIVSIFVNPTQFNNKNDFRKYPRNNKKDLSILKKLKVNFVFIPNKEEIYDTKRLKKIKLSKNQKILCAKHRNGHFEGVIDVMDRFTNIIKPKKIFMGKKDFQQLYLVKRYIENKYDCRIISCETIRNNYGLALSSRNLILKKDELKKAAQLTIDLIKFKKELKFKNKINEIIRKKKENLSKYYNFKFEYLELRNKKNLRKSIDISKSNLFFAYYIKKIRLIDNV